MQQFWVPASKALAVVAREGGEYGGREAICKRAHAGLLKSKARLLIVDDDIRENVEIPAHFWWADGEAALEQDWHRGDFSTFFDRDVEIRAFGVEFDFNGLREMIPPGEVAALARDCSVSADPAWMSAAAAQRFAYEKLGAPLAVAGKRLIDQARLGFVPARAVLMQRSNSGVSESWHHEEREWDVPDWFWEKFTQTGSSSQDWARGVFRGKGRAPTGHCLIKLTDVHFSKEALLALASGEAKEAASTTNRGGRPRKEYWDDLWCAVWGQVYHGELTPQRQADIERAMMEWIASRDEEVAESTIKPLARKMFIEMQREAKNLDR